MSQSCQILGLSAFYHDSAACLIRDGQIIAAAQEERFTRKKHDPRFLNTRLIIVCVRVGSRLVTCNTVAFYEKPFLKFDRICTLPGLRANRFYVPFLMSIPLWIRTVFG
jgi:carbamoyltransferase